MNTIIEVSNFKKKYHSHLVELEDIVITKRVNILVGKNGSGKSTILNAIADLISYEGEVLCNQKICIMSETVNYPKDIELAAFLKHLNCISSFKLSESDIIDLLISFNIKDKMKEKLNSLSKGMKAKVNIVQCLMEKADVYLLDEPLSGLDKNGVRCLINYIDKSDKVFIISTHLEGDFNDICDEVFYL